MLGGRADIAIGPKTHFLLIYCEAPMPFYFWVDGLFSLLIT